MLNFSVTFKSGSPVYEQVIYAVKKAIVSGQLKAGDPFPSVRELSKDLRINPNTAQKIVTNLVQGKLLEVRPGIGSLVLERCEATEEQRRNILDTEAEWLVVETKRLLIKRKELIDAITRHWGKDK